MSYAGNTILFHVMFDGRKNHILIMKLVILAMEPSIPVGEMGAHWAMGRIGTYAFLGNAIKSLKRLY